MLRFISFLVEKESMAKSMQTEIQARNHFKAQLEAEKARTGKDHVVVHFNGQEHHITDIEDAHPEDPKTGKKIGKPPKADFKLVDKHGNHIYLSHKKYDVKHGSDLSRSYPSLGGTSHLGNDHPIVKAMVNHIKKRFKGTMMGHGTVGYHLDPENEEHQKILKKEMFGHQHGEKDESGKKDAPFGINNIHAIVHGTLALKPREGGGMELSAHHIHMHNEPITEPGMIYARGAEKRNNHGLKQTRFAVGWVKGRAHKVLNPPPSDDNAKK